MQCKNNLKQLALGCLNHESLTKRFPTGGWGFGWTGDADRGTYGASRADDFTTSCPLSSRRRCTTSGRGGDHPEKRRNYLACPCPWESSIVLRGGGRWPTRGPAGPVEHRSSMPAKWGRSGCSGLRHQRRRCLCHLLGRLRCRLCSLLAFLRKCRRRPDQHDLHRESAGDHDGRGTRNLRCRRRGWQRRSRTSAV